MRWVALLMSSLLLTSLASAEDSSVYPPDKLQPFLGLDDTSPPTRVAPGRASAIQNVRLSSQADARKIPGLDMIGESLDAPQEDFCAVTGLTYAQFAGGTSRIVTICGQRASYFSGSTWGDINHTPWQANITGGQNNQFVFTAALSHLIATNDTNAPAQWAGGASDLWLPVAFTGLTNPVTAARSTTFFQNYLIFGNTVEDGTRYPTRVRWSNVGTINTWTQADFTDVDASAGQELNCIGQLYGDVYLGFTNSLYKMSLTRGSLTFEFTKVSNEAGCVAKNSMQQITVRDQTGLIFLDAKKQVYFFNGTTPLQIDQLIQTTMRALNGARLQYAVSAVDGEHYYLAVTGGGATSNNLMLDFNYLLAEWSKHVYTGVTGLNALARVTDSASNSQVYLGTGDSFVYQLTNTSLDNHVGSAGGVFESVSRIHIPGMASTLLVLYDAEASYTASGLIGATIELTGGTASGLVGVIVDNTTTGLVVARDFATTPDSTTAYEVGRINAYYTTRWDDFSQPALNKQGHELYFVADADIGSTLDVSYAVNFQSVTETLTASLTPGGSSLWGTAVWGTSTWGGGEAVFIGAADGGKIKLRDEGRWWRFTFTEDDRDENFRLHGWQVLYDPLRNN